MVCPRSFQLSTTDAQGWFHLSAWTGILFNMTFMERKTIWIFFFLMQDINN